MRCFGGIRVSFMHYMLVISVFAAINVYLFGQQVSQGPSIFPKNSGLTEVVEINRTTGQGYFITGRLDDPFLFNHSKSVSLLLATYLREYNLVSAELTFGDRKCRFTSKAKLQQDNSPLVLESESICLLDQGQNVPFELRIDVIEADARIALWAVNAKKTLGLIVAGKESDALLVGEVRYEDIAPQSRLSLLLYMWRDAFSYWSFLGILSFLLLLSGAYFYSRSPDSIWYTCAPALIFFGLSLWMAIIVPPFHAPDEPDHFISFSNVLNSPNHVSQSLELSRHGHFARIKQVSDGRFSSLSMIQPTNDDWTMPWQEGVGDSDMRNRSPLVYALWKALPLSVFGHLNIESQVLILRFVNGFLVSVAVLGLSLASTWMSSPYLVASSFLLAPALPFFAMGISNYPVFLTVTLFGCALAICLLRSSRRDALFSFLLGACLVLAALTSRLGALTAVPLFVFFLLLISMRVAISNNLGREIFYVETQIVAPFGGGLCFIYFFRNYPVMQEVFVSAHRYILTYLRGCPSDFLGPNIVVAGGIFVGQMSLLIGIAVRKFLATERLRRLSKRAFAKFPVFLVIVWLYLCLKAKWFIPNIEGNAEISALKYVVAWIKTLARDATFSGADFFATSSFWVGFGWLDVPFPRWFVLIVKVSPVLIIFNYLFTLRRNLRTWWWFFSGVNMLGLYLIALALSAFGVKYNLHGRYLLGFYLIYLVFAGLALSAAMALQKERVSSVTFALFSYVFLCQMVVSHQILVRYFG